MEKLNFYVLLIESGKELIIKEKINKILELNQTLILPTRELFIKKSGKTTLQTSPLFSGYIFLQAKQIIPEFLVNLKKINGFYKFLNSNKDIQALSKQDIIQLGSFLNPNYKASVSTVSFNKDDKIVVKGGPLKEFEGQIIKVDKRKQRAKVQLSLYNKSHTIDFAFQDLESSV